MGWVNMGAYNQPCQLGSLFSRSGCAWTRLLVCSGAAPASSPQAPSTGRGHTRPTGSEAHTPEIEMLQARLSPPFISPVSPGTASGEGGSRDGCGQAAQEKTCSHREAGSDLPAPLQLLVVKCCLLQPRSWPFLFPSSPSHTGLCSRIVPVLPCCCLPPSSAAGGQSSGALVTGCSSGIYFHSALQRQQLGAQLALLPLLQEAEMRRCGEVAKALGNGGTREQGGHSCLLGAHVSLAGEFLLLWRHRF